ncbi:MAG: tetratricopeptide repeat protein [Ignavibacteriales bacterium]|nr:tetratricopeptide repeat protein [Ignavibacteriales bacterium]
MVLNSMTGTWNAALRFIFAWFVVGSLALAGCATSEETTMEDEEFEEAPLADEQNAQEPAKEEESADQQALTSFIGTAPKKEEPKPERKPVEGPVVTPAIPPSTSPIEELRTENTSLKQKVVKLEQDVRTLSARMTDTEAKYLAEKERADKAEDAAKTAAQSAVISARGARVTEPVSGASMGTYEDALKTFNSRQYDAAVTKFERLLSEGVAPEWEDNCHYWLGESNFGKKSYAEAAKHFEKVFDYPKSEKLADAQFMLAQSYDRMGQKAKAKAAYERVVKDFPTSNNVQRAKERWARL